MSDYRVPGSLFTLREIIRDPRGRRKTAENELTILFCDILLEHAISLQEWELISDRYWNKRYPGDPIRAAQEKTNASRALTSDKLTWMRFDEFIQCLGAESYSYTVTLNHADGQKSEHILKIRNRYKDLDDVDNTNDDEDDDLKPVGYDKAESLNHVLELKFPELEPYIHVLLVENKGEDDV